MCACILRLNTIITQFYLNSIRQEKIIFLAFELLLLVLLFDWQHQFKLNRSQIDWFYSMVFFFDWARLFDRCFFKREFDNFFEATCFFLEFQWLFIWRFFAFDEKCGVYGEKSVELKEKVLKKIKQRLEKQWQLSEIIEFSLKKWSNINWKMNKNVKNGKRYGNVSKVSECVKISQMFEKP